MFFPIFLLLAAAGGSENPARGNCEKFLVKNLTLNVSVLSPDSVLLTWNNTDQYLTLEAVFSFVGKRWTHLMLTYLVWQCIAVGTQSFMFQVTITKFSSKASLHSPVIKYIWGTEMTHLMWNQKLFTSIRQVKYLKIYNLLLLMFQFSPS